MIGAGPGTDTGRWSRQGRYMRLRLVESERALQVVNETPAPSILRVLGFCDVFSPIPANAISTEQDLRSSTSASPESPINLSILHLRMMSVSTAPVIVDHPISFA